MDVAQQPLERTRKVLDAYTVAYLECRLYQMQSVPRDKYARRCRPKIYVL
jgi:hypothetical protein